MCITKVKDYFFSKEAKEKRYQKSIRKRDAVCVYVDNLIRIIEDDIKAQVPDTLKIIYKGKKYELGIDADEKFSKFENFSFYFGDEKFETAKDLFCKAKLGDDYLCNITKENKEPIILYECSYQPPIYLTYIEEAVKNGEIEYSEYGAKYYMNL